MNMIARLLVVLLTGMTLHGAQQTSIPYETPYDLQSDQAYTHYLPARVKALVDVAAREGIDAATEVVRTDKDLDSYLFILSIEEPVKMLAYSRQQQFVDKTASEIQQLIFPACTVPECSIAMIFKRLISTAHKGDTFAPYLWRINNTASIRYQVAYVHLWENQGQSYILGACMFVDYLSDNLILAHRTNTIVNRIKKDGFERVASLLANDSDPVLYFYVRQYEYPYRYLVHGGNQKLVSMDPEQAQRTLFSTCASEECSMKFIVERSSYVARLGGGAYAYLWRTKPELPVDLKVAYAQPFDYKGNKVFLGTGYTPPAIPGYIKNELPARAFEVVKQVREIGLNNTIADIKRKNSRHLYVFIVEQEAPHYVFVHLSPELSGHTPAQAQELMNKKGKSPFDLVTVFNGMAQYVKNLGSGFYAYNYLSVQGNEKSPRLKIAFLVTLIVNDQHYFVGASYEHEAVYITL